MHLCSVEVTVDESWGLDFVQPDVLARARRGETKAEDGALRAERELASLLAAGERVPEGLIREEDFTDPACAFVARLALSGGRSRIQEALEQVEDEALRGDITRLLTTGERVDPERRPQMIADCTDRLRLRRLEKEIDDCQARAARPGLTLQEQVELATRLNQLYDQVERLRRGAKGGEP